MQSTETDEMPLPAEVGADGPATPPTASGGGHERLRKSDVLAALQRQDYRCALTGRQLEPGIASVDHRTPVVKGGRHVAENIQILHCDLNRAKGSLTQDEFIALCREVVAFVGPPPASNSDSQT